MKNKSSERSSNDVSELPGVVAAMLDVLDDKCENVRESVFESIQNITKLNPVVVVHASLYYLELHPKISASHSALILRAMEETCKDQCACLDEDLAVSVAKTASEALTGEGSKEASDLLVALAKSHCANTMGLVLQGLEPGTTADPKVIRALGMLAASNAFGVVPFLKVAMSVIVPMLGGTREDALKQAFCYTIGKFSEAINEYLVNIEEAPDSNIGKDLFDTEMLLAYDTLAHTWLPASRDHVTTQAIVTAIGPISTLLPPDPQGRRLAKLLPTLLNMCKRSNLRLAATRVLATLLNSANEENKMVIYPMIEHIHGTLSDMVCITPFEASREAVLTHYEVLRCSNALVSLYAGEGLDRFLQQLKSPSAVQRSKALVVLRHLINTLPNEDDSALQRIALSLQESLHEGNARQLVGAIAAIAARSMKLLTPDQRACFVRFMVMQCSSKTDEGQSCEEALNLLATTVDGAESWLWSLLLNSLVDPLSSASSVIPVTRALTSMAVKIIQDEQYEELRNNFHASLVFGKSLELLGDHQNHVAVLSFLRSTAPLIGSRLEKLWDPKLTKVINKLQNDPAANKLDHSYGADPWEEEIVELLEESVLLEDESWSKELSDDLVSRVANKPGVAPFLASVTQDVSHTQLLIDLARTRPDDNCYARGVGICAKHELETVLKLMEESCVIEDSRKVPVKLLGLMKDLKAAATVEAAKAGLLRSYAEIARRGNAKDLFSPLDDNILPWIIRQLHEAKEISTKLAGLLALEQVGGAANPMRLPESTGFRMRGPALASVLALLQTSSGHRPLQLYSAILKAVISLIRIPPLLSPEEREVLLSTLIHKVVPASTEINSLLLPDEMQVLNSLGVVCSEVVADSSDALAELSHSLLPWMQTGLYYERKAALLTLRCTLRSYHDLLKYTYPGGRLEPGKLLGRILSRSTDPEPVFRSLVVDCVALILSISAKHRSTLPDNNIDHDLSEIKRVIINEDLNTLYEGVKTLAAAASERVAGGEAVALAEGLILDLNSRGDGGLASAISLAQHFKVRGTDLAHAAVHLTSEVLTQLRHIENASCKKGAINAIKTLATHHPHEVVEALLRQPLPLSKDAEICWKEFATSNEIGIQVLDLLLQQLTSNKMLEENGVSAICQEKAHVASFSSLAAVVALGHFFQATNSDLLIEKRLSELIFALLASMAAWLYANAPIASPNCKFGFVPNKEAYKINPHHEAYTALTQVLNVVNPNVAGGILNGSVFESDCKAEENLISTVCSVVRCITSKDTIVTLARSLCQLATSTIPAQRAVSAAFYSELVGRPGCGDVWLEAILNTLHEATADSSPLVRRLAIIGLTRVSYLDSDRIEEHIGSSIDTLLEQLEVPAGSEGGNGVALESLRGLAVLLSIKGQRLPNPRVILSLKPFIEKENWEMRLAAINALGAIAHTWKSLSSNADEVMSDHLLGCLTCLIVRLEDSNLAVAKAVRETLHDSANFLQSESLAFIIHTHLRAENKLDIEKFVCALIQCMIREIPQRVTELRSSVSRGYSRSENPNVRSTSALILGFLKPPEPDDVQRLLQLLRDTESIVRSRAAKALSMCFTL
ncbi:maestro heat-like repeat-containing protein family member 1 isoform X1 [Neodiprion pinetum]|uniref:maestro heat-like repeat-containing protein family member 1 isoform X1 n=1 Tax=Neodiprion pinetum TaxID=441929 RepID=UPI001EDF8F21|nr:maestro heat-like repeat-containing protein family member 1 isoform X1 [Neodiprion pinetum]